MKFEHLIEINDKRFPMMTELTREQLWAGLTARVHAPGDFILGLDGHTVDAQALHADHVAVSRTLDFGSFKVKDTVKLYEMDRTVTDIPATEMYPASRLTIAIEEPQPLALFLRFTYELDDAHLAEGQDAQVIELRKQAYLNADLDTVRKIRQQAHAAAQSGSTQVQ